MLAGSWLRTITAEACAVWNASQGLVQLLDGNWFQNNCLGTQGNQIGPESNRICSITLPPFCPNRLTRTSMRADGVDLSSLPSVETCQSDRATLGQSTCLSNLPIPAPRGARGFHVEHGDLMPTGPIHENVCAVRVWPVLCWFLPECGQLHPTTKFPRYPGHQHVPGCV